MTVALWILLGAYLLIAARWLWGVVEISRLSFAHMTLPPLPDRPPQPDDARLTVLVAAHNEGEHIADCLDRLRAQNYPIWQIIVINDRSSDSTGEVVARLARQDARIHLVEVQRLPDGWIGKTHALTQGAAHATGDYLLFVDSDVFLHPGAIAAVMDLARREKIEFLTLWPRLGLRSFADQLLVPPTGWLLSFWSWTTAGGGTSAANPVMGNGQFLMVKRDAYERIGGHAAVRAELAEDAVLAANAHRAALSRWVGFGANLYIAARNSSFSRCAHGLARVLIGSLMTPARVLLSTQIVLGACFAPFWILPVSLILLALGHNPALCAGWAAAALLHMLGMFGTLRRLFDLTLEQRGPLWLFPIGCLCTVGLLLWSFWIMIGRGTIRWGATRYSVRGSRILAPVTDGA